MRARTARPRPPTAPGFGDLAEIAEGDLVVHDEQGVGRYRGLKKLTLRGVAHDFLHLEYDGGGLYVPVYRIGVVHRFLGGTPETVRLDKLGGATWVEKRRRVSVQARKLAEDLLQLYAQRQALPGHAFPPPDVVFREFEETFPFEETADQDKAIAAVLADMQDEAPMDRLVCGDVGYGKTEVALRASLLAALAGRQVAVLAPTTVLVEQHAVTFAERLRDFPVQVASLSRFRSKREQQDTIAALASGKLDVVIGTHRLLSRDVHFRNLGLLIIDEEQRFGVAHKERLKEMRSQVDVLTLTATPIPRTLQMAMSGMREISIIATPPADRLAIRTFVCGYDPDLLREAIAKELARGGQVFFVHNRVEDLPKWMREVCALAPGARVGMAHGQMPEAKLERVMIDFVDGRYDILCCTTIIESGLDIPRANTMIVNHADRYGLAQLYQLRGRIGRAKERAFCYLVIPSEARFRPGARQRLAVLQRFTELGAGFQVATHDLEIRGAGEILGDRQSGLLAAVGFDTYARILEEAVAELRGQPIRSEFDPEIAVDVPAFLPDDYIPDTGQRLDFYRRLAQARDEGDVHATLAELEDRYGPLPDEARLLGEVMSDKTLVRRTGARAYELTAGRLVLSAGADARLDPAKVMRLVQQRGKSLETFARHETVLRLRRRRKARPFGSGTKAAAGSVGVRDGVGVAGSSRLCHANRMRRCLFCLAALAICACKPSPGPTGKSASRPGPVLARVDDTEITAADLQEVLARYAHTPFVLARYSTPEKKKELLDGLIRYELMAREAIRRGYDRDPDVQRIAKRQMVAQFEKREINDKLRAEDVPLADVEKYYREHQPEFVRPEEVRVSQILVHDAAAARRIAAEAKSGRNDAKSFRDLVERYSEDADSKSRAGDLTFFDRKTTRAPKALVDAAFAMTQVNDVAGPIASDKGFHIIKLTDRRAELTRPLAEVKVDIQKRLLDQMRAQRKRELAEEMRKSIRVEIYEDELAKVALAPTADGGQPPAAKPPVTLPAPTVTSTPKP